MIQSQELENTFSAAQNQSRRGALKMNMAKAVDFYGSQRPFMSWCRDGQFPNTMHHLYANAQITHNYVNTLCYLSIGGFVE